jgi:hypothetical protein
MTSVSNFIKIYELVQKLLGGHTDRRTGDLISLTFLFKGSRLKIILKCFEVKEGRKAGLETGILMETHATLSIKHSPSLPDS